VLAFRSRSGAWKHADLSIAWYAFACWALRLRYFLVGYVLIYVFAVKLGWLPVQLHADREGLWPGWRA